MQLTWFGTAAFRLATETETLLIDPYLSRNSRAYPHQPLTPADIGPAHEIFTTHGHFDHVMDIPAIMQQASARVHGSPETANSLEQKGVEAKRIRCITAGGYTVSGNTFSATAYPSRHVRFDGPLVVKTLAHAFWQLPSLIKLMRDYPVGQVYSWRFTVEGMSIHHFGSAGSTAEELLQFAGQKTDILLVPLQGHSDICRIALEYVRLLKPRLVIPHHQDNFYPPISQSVDIDDFAQGASAACPQTEVRVLTFNETVSF